MLDCRNIIEYNKLQPVFIMLTGVPGSGKSTVANEILAKVPGAVWLSSDRIREELYGDEACQTDPAKVFDLMNSRLLGALKDNAVVLYDATNINRKRRIALLNTLPKNTYKLNIIVWAKPETCYKRDAERNRTVGKQVIDKMIMNFQTPHITEGWDDVQLVRNDDELFDLYDDFVSKLSDMQHDNPHHPGTVQEHVDRVTDLVMTQYNGCNFGEMFLLARCHDIGKLTTKTFTNTKGETTDIAHYYNHQNTGAYYTLGVDVCIMADPILMSWLVNMHMEPFFAETKYFKNLDQKWKTFIQTFNEFDRAGA